MAHPDFSLQRHPENNSLYVHVPFCTSKCWYCDFYSMPDASAETMDRVCREIHAELHWFQTELGAEYFRTIFIGGGTPSVLPRRVLADLFEKLGTLRRPDAFRNADDQADKFEWTVEANPETLDRDFLDVCATSGVTRLSIGIQSLHDELLACLGRRARRADIERAFDLVSAHWKNDFNFDLITGIPGQTREMLFGDLTSALFVKPGHISLYTLSAEERTVLSDRLEAGTTRLPGEDDEAQLWHEAVAFLGERGFRQYEVSNFCRPGKECRHNLCYWSLEPYCGVGPSAVSTLPGKAKYGILRLQNPASIEEYCAGAVCNWNKSTEAIRPREFLLEHLMMGLRLAAGIPARYIKERFGKTLEELLPGLWEKWCGQGFAMARIHLLAGDDSYRLSDSGRLVLNRLLEEAALAIDKIDMVELAFWE